MTSFSRPKSIASSASDEVDQASMKRSSTCYPPDHIADIVRHQQRRAIGPDRHAHRSPIRLAFIGREETGQDVARRAAGATVGERYEHHPVAAELAAIPRTMLADRHAVGKPRQRA